MSLDLENANPDDLLQLGRDDAIERLCAIARAEAEAGDGRAVRQLMRLLEAAGLRRRKPLHEDNGS